MYVMNIFKQAVLAVFLILTGLVCVYAADISGNWTAEFDSQVGKQKYNLEFKADGANLTGMAISNIAGAEAKTPITDGKIEGDKISFVENLNYQGMPLRLVYEGTVSGDEIQLVRTEGGGGEKFTAKRTK